LATVLCSVCWQQKCLVIIKLAIFSSQTESTAKHFFEKKHCLKCTQILKDVTGG
jgi:hypothetical protein